ncbi:SDR family NAD(P)-dependent oxidoreductase [Nocardioides hwasunensis]|uniref:SDR family oxidoreductase n=1 Tax=Nocardioides hwasunensis TaxID=397258 RepID=A0ABR8MHY5_9ACTN|nr:SDR family NAD(P)-dependent oxidoreductase [Nocardioides hwasunensis]MBD3915672.1 SDR family oxidoreductase [Nocardioides hwasunensis]
MDLGIAGKKALITGGAGGIGRATAAVLLQDGVEVVLSDTDRDELDEAVAWLPDGARVHTVVADLVDDAAAVQLARDVEAAVGDIDILVNGAGITGPTGAFHELDDAAFTEVLTVNLLSAIRVTRAFLPALRGTGWARIVFVNSEDAMQPYDDELPYCAAKAGLLAFAKGLSRTYADEGVLVNSVSPAFISTPMTDAMMDQRAEEEGGTRDEAISSFLDEERPFMELGRRGEPEEVAAVIAFLCSARASFVNGANYRVDAGSVASL